MKTKKSKIKLLVVEDNRILREGLISILKPYSDIKVIDESSKGENTLLKIHQLKPTVILLDLGLRSQNSLNLVEKVKKEFPNAKVIVMDLVPVQADIQQFVEAGASGFVLKNVTLNEFLVTLRAVAKGIKVLPPDTKDSLFNKIIECAVKNGKTKLINSVKMIKREKEVLTLIGEGITNKDIAKRLKISVNNVKSHEHSIIEKLALRKRIEPSNFVSGIESVKAFSETISILHK
jgi:DNA-binding NarL/FixJ family response regulator